MPCLFADSILGGEIGHRKYDCPQQRNFTANIICRVCGNAGHMARDCPDRQRGQDWRNGGPPIGGRPTAGRIGGADGIDKEYESLMNELSGGAAVENGAPQFKLENGPGGYDNGPAGDNVKPWQRGPTGAPAPWKTGGAGNGGGFSGRDDGGSARPWASGGGGGGARGGRDNFGGGGYNNYGGGRDSYAGGSGGAAPWQQPSAPPPPPGGQQYGGYGYGQGAYDQYNQSAAAPPPPGMGNYGYQAYGTSGSPAPPPPPVSH